MFSETVDFFIFESCLFQHFLDCSPHVGAAVTTEAGVRDSVTGWVTTRTGAPSVVYDVRYPSDDEPARLSGGAEAFCENL
jgi:hypothetical protein